MVKKSSAPSKGRSKKSTKAEEESPEPIGLTHLEAGGGKLRCGRKAKRDELVSSTSDESKVTCGKCAASTSRVCRGCKSDAITVGAVGRYWLKRDLCSACGGAQPGHAVTLVSLVHYAAGEFFAACGAKPAPGCRSTSVETAVTCVGCRQKAAISDAPRTSLTGVGAIQVWKSSYPTHAGKLTPNGEAELLADAAYRIGGPDGAKLAAEAWANATGETLLERTADLVRAVCSLQKAAPKSETGEGDDEDWDELDDQEDAEDEASDEGEGDDEPEEDAVLHAFASGDDHAAMCGATGDLLEADSDKDVTCPACVEKVKADPIVDDVDGTRRSELEPGMTNLEEAHTDLVAKRDATRREREWWERLLGEPIFAGRIKSLEEETDTLKEEMVTAEKASDMRTLQAKIAARRELLRIFKLETLRAPALDAEKELRLFEETHALFLRKTLPKAKELAAAQAAQAAAETKAAEAPLFAGAST
jgi:hypothetical protein